MGRAEKYSAIAELNGPEKILLRAAEEHAEAAAAILRYHRSLYGGDLPPGETLFTVGKAMAAELADCEVMFRQMVRTVPDLSKWVKASVEQKIERTLERYHVEVE